MAAPELILVHSQSGELVEDENELKQRVHDLEEVVENLEREARYKLAVINKLRKKRVDEDEEARKRSPNRERVIEVFDTWRTESGHLKCKLTPERFDMIEARLSEGYEPSEVLMAAIGVAVNPYVIEGERKDDFKTAMRSGERVEAYANRCPPERRRELSGRLFS